MGMRCRSKLVDDHGMGEEMTMGGYLPCDKRSPYMLSMFGFARILFAVVPISYVIRWNVTKSPLSKAKDARESSSRGWPTDPTVTIVF